MCVCVCVCVCVLHRAGILILECVEVLTICIFLMDHVFSMYQIAQGLHDSKKFNSHYHRVMRSFLLWLMSWL